MAAPVRSGAAVRQVPAHGMQSLVVADSGPGEGSYPVCRCPSRMLRILSILQCIENEDESDDEGYENESEVVGRNIDV